jgi:hypothetical protein
MSSPIPAPHCAVNDVADCVVSEGGRVSERIDLLGDAILCVILKPSRVRIRVRRLHHLAEPIVRDGRGGAQPAGTRAITRSRYVNFSCSSA